MPSNSSTRTHSKRGITLNSDTEHTHANQLQRTLRGESGGIAYAAAATTGAAGGASTAGATGASSTGAGVCSAAAAGSSRGATGVGSSSCGAASSTLGVVAASACLGLGLKRSATRELRRRETLAGLEAGYTVAKEKIEARLGDGKSEAK